MTPESVSIQLTPQQVHILLSALEAYTSHVSALSLEAGENNGKTLLVPNEGNPAAGLDVAKLDELFRGAETMMDNLLALIPDDQPITATYDDGTPFNRDSIEGFPVPVNQAIHLYRQLDALDDPAQRGITPRS